MKKTSIIALLCCFNTVQSHTHRTEKTTSIRTQPDGNVIRETTIKNTQDGVNTETHIIETTKPQAKPMGGDGSQTYCQTVSPEYHQKCCAKIKDDGKEYNAANNAFCARFNHKNLEKTPTPNQMATNDINYDDIDDIIKQALSIAQNEKTVPKCVLD